MTTAQPRLLVAAAASGSGKTTIVCGLLAALYRRGLRVGGYKVGPDYIDPGFHRAAGHCEVLSLDTWLTPPAVMKGLFARTSRGADVAVAEGVMGLYDGGRGGVSSSAEIAKLLGLPVVLVVDARSMGQSAAAVALGFREYDRSVDLRGVILNRLGSASHRDTIAEALERVGIPLLGAVMRDEALALPERHLGLVPEAETHDAAHLDRIREAVERGVDVDALLAIARSAPPLSLPPEGTRSRAAKDVRIAVAQDLAFSFYYPDSLSALEDRGAELISFSPMQDEALPEADGVILGGGFPERFAGELAANASMRRSVARAAERGVPILAECGGMMYLCRSITDMEGAAFEMAGVLPASCRMQHRLEAVGYVEARALRDTVLGPVGTLLRGHEFHFSAMTPEAEDFPWAFRVERKRTGAAHSGGYARGNVLASYLHLNLAGLPDAADSFLARCRAFRSASAGGR